MNNREKLIKQALMDKLSDGMEIYTADDILTVADISDEEMTAFREIIEREIDTLAKKRRNTN